MLVLVVALVVLGGAIGVALLASGGDEGAEAFPEGSVPKRAIGDLDRAAEAARCEVADLKSEGKTETGGDVEYEADPPHSGDHAPEPAEDAAYRSDPPPDENLVHTLFHGRIVIWFSEDVGDAQLGALKALYDESPEHVLMVPRDSMDAQVAATAWRHSLTCAEMNDGVYDAIRAFRDTWRDRGPEFVP